MKSTRPSQIYVNTKVKERQLNRELDILANDLKGKLSTLDHEFKTIRRGSLVSIAEDESAAPRRRLSETNALNPSPFKRKDRGASSFIDDPKSVIGNRLMTRRKSMPAYIHTDDDEDGESDTLSPLPGNQNSPHKVRNLNISVESCRYLRHISKDPDFDKT